MISLVDASCAADRLVARDQPQAAAAEPEVELAEIELEPTTKPRREPDPTASDRAAQLANGLDRAGYEADLRFIAAARPPDSAHWQAVQDRCADSLAASGFTVSRVSAERAGTSVVGRKQGQDASAPAIVVGAHYDHVEDCPGADDNASGTAAALALARTLGPHEWTRTLYVACWDELHGSAHWADQIVAEGQSIALYLNFDAIGYADDTPNSQTLPPGAELLFPAQLQFLNRSEAEV